MALTYTPLTAKIVLTATVFDDDEPAGVVEHELDEVHVSDFGSISNKIVGEWWQNTVASLPTEPVKKKAAAKK